MDKKDIGIFWQTLRKRKDFTQQEAAERASMSTKTLQRVEMGENTSFHTVYQLLKLYNASPLDLSSLLGLFEDGKDARSASRDQTPAHLKRLKQYANTHYHCYYVSSKRGDSDLSHLTIRTGSIDENGFLPGTATLEHYQYECKLVSPPDSSYSFIYLTSEGNLRDRAFIILPFNPKITRKFNAGIGMMLSLSMDIHASPCFQKLMIISDFYTQPKKVALNRLKTDFLSLLGGSAGGSPTFKIYSDDLAEESQNFFHHIKKTYSRK